ncbi:MAG: cytochrome c biogenesis protein CcsA [Fimbriimonadaceae bacterium]|nr:cytochrome c biogenesis protein CcsA [Fimbriimonadaceae bacterium]
MLKWLYFLAVSAMTVWTFFVPPAEGFQRPELARIVFFHLPCAIGSSIFMTMGAYFGIRYLVKKDIHWSVRTEAALEMGLTLGLLTLFTGIIFSKVQWGAWWNWDPRQTSYLFVMLIIGAYFAIRAAFSDRERAAAASCSYVAAATLPMLFFVFVYARLKSVTTLHPDVVRDNGFDPTYKYTFYSLFLLVFVGCFWMYRLRVKAGLMELDLEDSYGQLETDRGGSAAAGVVRPISVSAEDGSESQGG